MQVEWSTAALEDRAAIIEYLLPRNPHALKRILQRLKDATTDLSLYPYMGRKGIDNTHEWVIASPYVVIYEINKTENRLKILRIWHMSQSRD